MHEEERVDRKLKKYFSPPKGGFLMVKFREMNEPALVHEDDHLVVINKPSGWIVNEAATTGDTPVLQSWLKENFDFQISASKGYRSGIVHRLDKETSGVLVVAKTKDAFKALQEQFKRREVKKEYLALVHGKVVPKEGKIEVPVGRLPWNRERFGVMPGGKHSLTRYAVERYLRNDREILSFVRLFPETGRTHQIRIHLKYLGHAVVSDEFYAGRKTAKTDRVWCPRLFLHAEKIQIKHPKGGVLSEFCAELAGELNRSLSSLDAIS